MSDPTKEALDALDRLLRDQYHRAQARQRKAPPALEIQGVYDGEMGALSWARGAVLGILTEHLEARRCESCGGDVEHSQNVALCIECAIRASYRTDAVFAEAMKKED